MFYVFEVFLEALSDGIGGLADILLAAGFAGDGIHKVVEFTREFLGYDVASLCGVAAYGATVVTEGAVSAVASVAEFGRVDFKVGSWCCGVISQFGGD